MCRCQSSIRDREDLRPLRPRFRKHNATKKPPDGSSGGARSAGAVYRYFTSRGTTAAGQGFEPQLRGPEPRVLPLDDPAMRERSGKLRRSALYSSILSESSSNRPAICSLICSLNLPVTSTIDTDHTDHTDRPAGGLALAWPCTEPAALLCVAARAGRCYLRGACELSTLPGAKHEAHEPVNAGARP